MLHPRRGCVPAEPARTQGLSGTVDRARRRRAVLCGLIAQDARVAAQIDAVGDHCARAVVREASNVAVWGCLMLARGW